MALGVYMNTAAGNKRKLIIALFAIYILAVLWITLIDREFRNRCAMLVPFWEFANVIKGIRRSYFIGQILGNLVMLMPLGFMLPVIRKVSLKQVLLISLCFSAGIELTQFITGRGLMEFDDVFNNTVGAVLGYIVYDVMRERI
ncbi:MAG: VanZ family protein [Oscillospiraceae bacterium]|nr:VanZ family protein [Oscillospiraceae bacterium]